jgi:hypothetical protein
MQYAGRLLISDSPMDMFRQIAKDGNVSTTAANNEDSSTMAEGVKDQKQISVSESLLNSHGSALQSGGACPMGYSAPESSEQSVHHVPETNKPDASEAEAPNRYSGLVGSFRRLTDSFRRSTTS